MNALDTAGEALAKLKIHEEAIGRLYKRYSERFGEQRAFWCKLSREEYQHAKWIEMLEAELGDDPAGFVARGFPLAAIEHSLAFIEKLIAKAGSEAFTVVNAVSAALNLERGLLENKYFEAFETDRAKMKRLLALLEDKTRDHYASVQQVWQELSGAMSMREPA